MLKAWEGFGEGLLGICKNDLARICEDLARIYKVSKVRIWPRSVKDLVEIRQGSGRGLVKKATERIYEGFGKDIVRVLIRYGKEL